MQSTIKFQSKANGKGVISYGLELVKDANIPHKHDHYGYFKLGNTNKWNNCIVRFSVLTSERIQITIVSMAYGNYKLIGSTEYGYKDSKWRANPYTDKWVKIVNRMGERNFDLNNDAQQTMYLNVCTLFDVLLADFVKFESIAHLINELSYAQKRRELEFVTNEIRDLEIKLAALRNERDSLAESLAASETNDNEPTSSKVS